MTELDQALEQCKNRAADQSLYYEVFLNTRFSIPTLAGKEAADSAEEGIENQISPVVHKAEGKSFLLLFDSEERFYSWTNGAVGSANLLGHVVIDLVPEGVSLAVNLGTRFYKELTPEEIGYLKGVVARIREVMAQGEN